jgi:hypothetical protein
MDKYFIKKRYKNGEIISMLVTDYYNTNKYKNILFIRTPTTGGWLDQLLTNDNNITRILYNVKKNKQYIKTLSNVLTIDSIELENTLNSLNKKFDLICVDPCHEYYESKRDLFYLFTLLNDNGIMICHDCFPSNKIMATPKYNVGDWSGETYVAFVEFAYKNPDLFYCVLNIDTGIGIISKTELESLQNNFNREKQEQLLLLHQNSDDVYTYFCDNSKDIINTITLKI